jgi:hypothetical protein
VDIAFLAADYSATRIKHNLSFQFSNPPAECLAFAESFGFNGFQPVIIMQGLTLNKFGSPH